MASLIWCGRLSSVEMDYLISVTLSGRTQGRPLRTSGEPKPLERGGTPSRILQIAERLPPPSRFEFGQVDAGADAARIGEASVGIEMAAHPKIRSASPLMQRARMIRPGFQQMSRPRKSLE